MLIIAPMSGQALFIGTTRDKHSSAIALLLYTASPAEFQAPGPSVGRFAFRPLVRHLSLSYDAHTGFPVFLRPAFQVYCPGLRGPGFFYCEWRDMLSPWRLCMSSAFWRRAKIKPAGSVLVKQRAVILPREDTLPIR